MRAQFYNTWVVSLFALLLFAAPAFSTLGHVYLSGSVGPSYAKLGKSTPRISYLSGVLITDAYPLKSDYSLSVTLSVNGGYEFTGAKWMPAIMLGCGGYFNPQYYYRGQAVETAAGDPSSTLYNYHYHINTTRLMAEMQLTWILAYVSPFINLGVGPAWNRASGYKETAVTSTGYPPLPPFHSQTNLNCAYQAGLGISTAFNFCENQSCVQQERVSVGYRYVYLGKTAFGTRGSAYPYQLNTGSLMLNDVYFSYTHLF